MGELNRIIFVTATDVQASNFDTSSTSDVNITGLAVVIPSHTGTHIPSTAWMMASMLGQADTGNNSLGQAIRGIPKSTNNPFHEAMYVRQHTTSLAHLTHLNLCNPILLNGETFNGRCRRQSGAGNVRAYGGGEFGLLSIFGMI